MITSFEVGAVFKIINEASPALLTLIRQMRTLNKEIDKAKLNFAEINKAAAMGNAIAQTNSLAGAWKNVAAQSTAAQRSIAQATKSARASLPPPTGPRVAPPTGGGGGGAGGGGGRGRAASWPGRRGGGGGAHISGPSASIPGGSHVRFGGGAAAAAGLLGYGAYEAAQMEDAVWQLIYHSGQEQNDSNRGRFRKILQDAMAESGYSLHDVAESAKQEIRMFQGTPGGGMDILPEMLRAATIESRLKGESPEESMRALIGLAHMTKQYSPEAIKKLAPAFAFLSTANPSSLSSIERAAGYAVPLLQSGLEIDPMQSLLLGTALTRAGATSTKSGTWLREMALRAMPGTSMMSKMAFRKHEEALKAFGLVDDQHKPTWFTDGKPDLFKMLDIAGAKANSIPLDKRAAYERSLFGAQGGGGFALLADPAVRDQVQALQKEMNSPDFKNRYAGFSQAYQQGSSVQQARTGLATFNNTMMDLGQHALPSVNNALTNLKSILNSIRDMLPKAPNVPDGVMGGHGLLGAGAGAVAGAAVGMVGGPVGALGGAAIGGVLGVAEGFMETYNDRFKLGLDRAGTYTSPGKTGRPAQPIEVKTAPITMNLNLDGHTLAQAISGILQSYYNFGTSAAAADGVSQPFDGGHNTTDH